MRVLLVTLALGISLAGQSPPPSTPSFAFENWKVTTPPLHIAGPIYYVGTAELAAYLITSPQGHILLDGALGESAPDIAASIRALGFKVEDIRILLNSQAHMDHAGSLAWFKRQTGARLEVMQGDAEVIESGGRKDFLFADVPAAHFEPVQVDRVLKDGDVVSLGGLQLTARHTPGHTPGCTTWLMSVEDAGRRYRVVFPGSTTVNPGTRLVGNPAYPGIADDFRKTFVLLESLQPEIFLAAHASFFDLEGKRQKAASEGAKAFVDPEGYRRLHARKKRDFDTLLAGQSAP